MNAHLAAIAELASANHGIVGAADIERCGISAATRSRWVAAGLLVRLGPRSYAVAGAPVTWEQRVAATIVDLDGRGFLAGRTAARLHGLDGFTADAIEVLVPRASKHLVVPARLASTAEPLDAGATVTVRGMRCLTAERLILDAPLFDFSRAEVENAIDSALRMRLVAEQRLRTKVLARHRRGINHGRTLLDALVDTGGHSRLERWTLALLREAGLPHPLTQVTYRDGTRIVARVDFQIGDLVVEVNGHGTHSSRQQLQADEQRRTELTCRGLRVVVFQYADVRDRPQWVAARIRRLLALAA